MKKTHIHKLKGRMVFFFMLFFNLFVLLATFWYYNKTKIHDDITITSEYDFATIIKTPPGNSLVYHSDSLDSLVVHKRPLSKIICVSNGNIYTFSDFNHISGAGENSIVKLKTKGKNSNTLLELIHFFINQKFLFLWFSCNLVFIFILLFANRRKIYRRFLILKYSFFRFILKNKEKPALNNMSFRQNISKKSFVFLILLASIYSVSLFTGLSHRNIDQIGTERIRALIALEMKLSNNYIAPTINGEYYYNKPPFYNLLLIPFADSQHYPEFKLRSITAISVILLGILMFFLSKIVLDPRKALFAVLLFSTTTAYYLGYSLQIRLDPFFSLLVLGGFLINYSLAKKRKFFLMFATGYFIAALAFLTKGIPAIYFQAVSVTAACIVFKSSKKIISIPHLLGIAIFVFIIGFYFIMYNSYNSPLPYLTQLILGEPSLQLDIDPIKRLLNTLSFTGKTILAYSPIATLLPLLLLKKTFYQIIKDHFSAYSIIIIIFVCLSFFFGNFQPHYILCIIPLMIILIIKLYVILPSLSIRSKLFILGFNLIAIFLELIIHSFAFDYFSMNFNFYLLLSLLITLPLILMLLFPSKVFYILTASILLMIISRIIFPEIQKTMQQDYSDIKAKAGLLIKKVGISGLVLYPGQLEINHSSLYYLTYYYGKIIYKTNEPADNSCFYLTTKEYIPKNACILDSIGQRHQFRPGEADKIHSTNNQLFLYLMR